MSILKRSSRGDWQRQCGIVNAIVVGVMIVLASGAPNAAAQQPDRGFGRCTPRSQRGADSVGCFVVGDAKSRPRNGKLVATIGPLPITAGRSYSALYMEAVMRPGTKSAIHRHSGPEAWYTLSGETCLETPNGSMVGRAGGPPVIVPGGGPMELTATGSGIRRSLVLILHDSRRPPTTIETTWKPRGLCRPSGVGRPQ